MFDKFPVALRLGFALLWENLVATMCDDSEAVAVSLENEECPIASSTISASIKATDFAQALLKPCSGPLAAMPDRTENVYGRMYVLPPYDLPPSHLLNLDSRAKVPSLFTIYYLMLIQLYLLGLQSSTRKSNKDTFNSHMQLTKDAALRQDTIWIAEIEIMSEARIQMLKDKIKRGKRAAVKFKQIYEIEFELAILNRKLADAESGVKYVQTGFADMMTIMETLVSEMKKLKADIAMQAERCKGKSKRVKSGHSFPLCFCLVP